MKAFPNFLIFFVNPISYLLTLLAFLYNNITSEKKTLSEKAFLC